MRRISAANYELSGVRADYRRRNARHGFNAVYRRNEKLLFIDAMDIDGNVGDFYQFTGDELNAYFKNKMSVHDLGVNDMLAVLKLTDNPVDEIVVMGIKPQVVSMGVDLTPAVAAKIPQVAQKAKEVVDKWVAQYQK